MSLWRRSASLDELNSHRERTLLHTLGIVFSEIGADYLSARMLVDERTHQPHGLLHGGASVVLAETVGSTAANLCVDGERQYCVGQEINANHLQSVRGGWVTGTARAVHLGGRSQVWSIEIHDEAGALICISRLTMAVLELKRPSAT